MDQLLGDLNSTDNSAMQLAGLMNNHFQADRAATMDPAILNSLNSQMDVGYGALSGLYGMSDYGFNTGSPGYAAGSYTTDRGDPSFWMDPSRGGRGSMFPGGRF